MKKLGIEKELSGLSDIMKSVNKHGKKGVYATQWYADMRTIINSRISELNKRSEMMGF